MKYFEEEELMRVVGFCGRLNSGKTTAAKLMVEKLGHTSTSFAESLKKMCLALGLKERQVYGTLAEKNQEFYFVPDEALKLEAMRIIPQSVMDELRIDPKAAQSHLDIIYPTAETGYKTTGRKVMQLLGTEWGRSLNDALWTTIWRHKVDAILVHGGKASVEDCRFPNEVDALHRYHKRNLIEIQCPEVEQDVGITGHASEKVPPGDVVVTNYKISKEKFWSQIERALKELQE
jgi:hypothetical protein